VGFPLKILKCLLLACLSTLASCAVYTIDIHLADGTSATGKAIVVNNSDGVQLTVESEAFTATFGKVGTDGAIQAETLSNVISGALNPL
jgi:hypothetical protein